LLDDFASAFVWGKSVKYSPYRCGLSHVLADEDVIQMFKKVQKTTISNVSKNATELPDKK